MKKINLTLFVLIFSAAIIHAQGNYPMATIIPGQEEKPPVITEKPSPPLYHLYWEGVSRSIIPPQITAGDRIILVLCAVERNSHLPPPEFFMPEVPHNVILAISSISAEERNSGIVIKLMLIPLKEGEFILPARVLEYENIRFEILELKIKVN